MNCEEYYESEFFLSHYMEYDKKTGEWGPVNKEAVRKSFERQAQKEKNIDKLAEKSVLLDAYSKDVLDHALTTDLKNDSQNWTQCPVVAHQIHNKINRERFSYMKELKAKGRV